MSSDPRIGAGDSAPWYRVVALPDISYGGTAERDYASVLPALLDAAQGRRPLVAGWLSRGFGAPLELLTNAGPLPSIAARPATPGGRRKDGQHPYGPPEAQLPPNVASKRSQPERCELLFPWGARGVRCPDSLMADLDAMVWAPCPARQAPPGESGAPWAGSGVGLAAPATLFESALTTLMARPFGWLVVAEPTDLIDVEIAELREQVNVLRRYDEEV